jgi:SAM-dependent methyltransferase
MITIGAGQDYASEAGAKEVGPWSTFPDFHARFKPPLRPSESDVASIRTAIAGRDARVVLLGVTPELACFGDRLTAVDYSPQAIAKIWPGDNDRRRAVLADWRDMPIESGNADAVIGDGSLNAIAEGLPDLLGEIARVLSPSGRVAVRVFCSPEEPETLEALRRSLMDGEEAHIDTFRWRLMMALAALRPDWTIAVAELPDALNAMFPDRAALSRITGWTRDDFETIDCYVRATHRVAFPPLHRLIDIAKPVFGTSAVLVNGPYPLCARCPTVVLSR